MLVLEVTNYSNAAAVVGDKISNVKHLPHFFINLEDVYKMFAIC